MLILTRDPDCCIADLNMDGVIGLIDRFLMSSAMVEFVEIPARTARTPLIGEKGLIVAT